MVNGSWSPFPFTYPCLFTVNGKTGVKMAEGNLWLFSINAFPGS